MKNCQNCQWDKLNPQGQKMIQCGQGHIRTFQKIIENCHAWEEKKKCWCEYPQERRNNMIVSVRDMIGVGPYPFWDIIYCPACGKEIKEEK